MIILELIMGFMDMVGAVLAYPFGGSSKKKQEKNRVTFREPAQTNGPTGLSAADIYALSSKLARPEKRPKEIIKLHFVDDKVTTDKDIISGYHAAQAATIKEQKKQYKESVGDDLSPLNPFSVFSPLNPLSPLNHSSYGDSSSSHSSNHSCDDDDSNNSSSSSDSSYSSSYDGGGDWGGGCDSGGDGGD